MGNSNKYEIDTKKVLGTGTYGNVYKSKCGKVAIKMVKKNSETKVAIETEEMIPIVNGCQYLMKLFDIKDFDDSFWIIMEVMEGRDLFDYALDVNGVYLFKEINMIIRSVLSGLQHLNKNGFIHCDVKPDNIRVILDKNKVVKNVKLFDYSLMQKISKVDKKMAGTFYYCAPEIFFNYDETKNATTFDEKIDIWSLAVSIYCCIELVCFIPDIYINAGYESVKYYITQYLTQDYIHNDMMVKITSAKWCPEIKDIIFNKMMIVDSSKRWSVDQLLA